MRFENLRTAGAFSRGGIIELDRFNGIEDGVLIIIICRLRCMKEPRVVRLTLNPEKEPNPVTILL